MITNWYMKLLIIEAEKFSLNMIYFDDFTIFDVNTKRIHFFVHFFKNDQTTLHLYKSIDFAGKCESTLWIFENQNK